MSETPVSFPRSFSFIYTDDEIDAFREIGAARQDPGPEYWNFYATIIALIFGIGLTVVAAHYAGLFEARAFRPVLATAYIAFIAGAFGYYVTIWLGYRRIGRLDVDESLARYRDASEMVFKDEAIIYKTVRLEMRIPWGSVTEIRETALLILIWIARTEGLAVPVRLFTDKSERHALVAAIRRKVPRPETKV